MQVEREGAWGIIITFTSLLIDLFVLLNKKICAIYEIILNAFLFLYEKMKFIHKISSEYVI